MHDRLLSHEVRLSVGVMRSEYEDVFGNRVRRSVVDTPYTELVDPTNGILTQTHHVRVAVGRQYSDATPTTGTIYLGGGGEKLEVLVRCEPESPEGQCAGGRTGCLNPRRISRRVMTAHETDSRIPPGLISRLVKAGLPRFSC